MAKLNRIASTSLALFAGGGMLAPAYGFDYNQDDFSLQLDTTVSIGASWRADDRDYRQVGSSNAAAAFLAGSNPGNLAHLHGSSAADDSNLLWRQGSTFSEVAKITMDLEMKYKNYGAFVRGKAFYDNKIIDGDGVTDKPAYYWRDAQGQNILPNQSDGRSGDILDAFVWGDWWLGDKPLNVRLGKQVISWGEGLLYANGINSVNPIDVDALLTPGAEIKDALLPVAALYASLGVTESLSLEAFYLLEWRQTKLPACGTFFAISDLVGSSCFAGFYPSGLEASMPAGEAVRLPRGADVEPDDSGQFGLAARYFVDAIETEFGFYYMNYHSRLPSLSGHYPTTPGGIPLALVRDFAVAGNPPSVPPSPLNTIALLPAADYFVEYAEDIQLYGVSFSSTIDFGLPGGATAVSGEISMRQDMPLQREDGDALAGSVGLPSLACYDAAVPYDCYSSASPGDYSQGYVQRDYYQAELVFIQFFDQILGASRWTAVLDIAGSYFDMPSKTQAILNSSYNATLNFPGVPDVSVAGFPLANYPEFLDLAYGITGNPVLKKQAEYYPTSGAWGYQLRFTGEYNNVFDLVNLRPTLSFKHDVYGTTPSPIANFLEDSKALGLSLEGVVLNKYSVTLSYTDFYGAEPYNQLADRDYYSLSAQASF